MAREPVPTTLRETDGRKEQVMKRLLIAIAGLALVAGLGTATADVSAATKVSTKATIVIRHQTHGCHAWSLDGSPYRAVQTARLARGGTITFMNNDLMPHKLVQTNGPKVRIENLTTPMAMGMHGPSSPGAMNHMGATTKVWFTHAGIYRFTTKPGEDYMKGIKTTGEDNVLRLIVKVS